MEYDPEIHHRRSIRLSQYNYSGLGTYFITICTHQKQHTLGEIVEGEMQPNAYGKIVEFCWQHLSRRYPVVQLDEFILMPNHMHGIIRIVDIIPVGAIHESPLVKIARPVPTINAPPVKTIGVQPQGAIHESPLRKRRQMLLPKIVGYLKMNTAKQINETRNTPGVPVWQRNYYEHIIRNDDELSSIREYITTNPLRWRSDPENRNCRAIHESPLVKITPSVNTINASPVKAINGMSRGAIHESPP